MLTLQRLVKLGHSEQHNDSVVKFLQSEAYVSSLSAQFLNDEVGISCLLDAGICILNLLKAIPQIQQPSNEEAPLKLTPDFGSFFFAFMENIKKKMSTAEVDDLSPDTLVRFFRSLQEKSYSKVDASFVNEYKKQLLRKIP